MSASSGERARTFSVTLSEERWFELPFDVRAIYGEARPPVRMSFCGETFRTRVAVYGGKPMLAIWKPVLKRLGLRAGKKVEITVAPDAAPRTVTPPRELAAALKKSAAARAGWEAMSFTHRREWAEAIRGAKKPETRERRVEQALAALVARVRRN